MKSEGENEGERMEGGGVREEGKGGVRKDKERAESPPVAEWVRHWPPKARREEGGSVGRREGRGEREVREERSR